MFLNTSYETSFIHPDIDLSKKTIRMEHISAGFGARVDLLTCHSPNLKLESGSRLAAR